MTTTRAARIHEHGGPDALRWESVALHDPASGEALIQHTAIGLNYIDTYHRTGLYPVESLPATLGVEAVGVVERLGEGVDELRAGDRVAYTGSLGAYAERRVVPANRLVPVPATLDDETVAATLLKGLTAQMLLRRVTRVAPDSTVLVHAAAGGVGLLLCQWASALGARVLGTVGTDAKAELARANGCKEPIVYTREDFPDRVLALAPEGVEIVLDGVGAATFEGSLRCLAPFGMMVSFGNASGAVPPVRLLDLTPKNLFVTRPSMTVYTQHRSALVAAADELFEAMQAGTVRATVGQRFPLAQVAQAHQALEARRTTGSTVLVP